MPDKSTTLTLEEIDDAEFSRWMRDQLTRVRDLLLSQGLDDEMISALDQAILDNEHWVSPEVEKTMLETAVRTGTC